MYFTERLITHRLGDDATLFVNTLSGAIDVFNDEQIRKIDALLEGDASLDPELAGYLTSRRYLFYSEQEEQCTLLALRDKIRSFEHQREPTVFAVCPTYHCFFRCTYCYARELTATTHRSTIRPKDFIAGIEQMEEFLRRNFHLQSRPAICFLGGEPLQESTRDTVLSVVNEGVRRGYRFKIVTNGFNLDAFVEDLVRYVSSLQHIQITLDGPSDVHNERRPLASGDSTFERVTKNIQHAVDAGLPVLLRTNLDLMNVYTLKDLAQFIQAQEWSAQPNFKAYLAPTEDSHCRGLSLGREDELLRAWLSLKEGGEWQDLLAIFDDSKLFRVTDMLETNIFGGTRKVLPRFSYCAATKGKVFVFGPEGNVYQCPRGIGDSRASIGTFWPTFHIQMSKMMHWLERDITRLQCTSCTSIATLHGGGCALEALNRTGTLDTCVCDNALDVVSGYLEFRKEQILQVLQQPEAAAPNELSVIESDEKRV
jgi:uncharacterized protein